ncbi:hypothetical protein BU16DRAFT_527832 [Lophium mytilinum]|uniref:Uncharacterized protein n=1 Tax=Lophium mytilinum TaxID=390894 RepID=A0A6A6QR33_9PEZI|nr:hypothetical protein BU16DRAFT_527832 [Lophium mytilinum]
MAKKKTSSTSTNTPTTMSARKRRSSTSTVAADSPTPATNSGSGRSRKGSIFSSGASHSLSTIASFNTPRVEGPIIPVDSQDSHITRSGTAYTHGARVRSSSVATTPLGSSPIIDKESLGASNELRFDIPSGLERERQDVSFELKRQELQTPWHSPDHSRVRKTNANTSANIQTPSNSAAYSNTATNGMLSVASTPIAVANATTNGDVPGPSAAPKWRLRAAVREALHEAPRNPFVPIALVLSFFALLLILWAGLWSIVWTVFTICDMLDFGFPKKIIGRLGDSIMRLSYAYYHGSDGHDQIIPKMHADKYPTKEGSWSWTS